MPVCACICIHDDFDFLADTLAAAALVPRYTFVSRVNWNHGVGPWEESKRIAESSGATVGVGDWVSEEAHRLAAYQAVMAEGFTHAIILDSDEIIESELLGHLIRISQEGLAERVYVEWDTYWKSVEYVIRPRGISTPCMMIDLRVARNPSLRDFVGGRALVLDGSYGIVHHLSYAGTDERIRKKTTTWSHRDEVRPGWFERVWNAWDANRTMRNLHPAHPEDYGFAERITPPDCLSEIAERERTRACDVTPPNPGLGSRVGSSEQWEAAIPESLPPEVVMRLFDAAVERADFGTARQMLRLICECEGYAKRWSEMVVRLSDVTGLDPCAHFVAVLSQDEANVAVRKALAIRLLNTACLDAAIAQFDILQSCGVAEGAYALGVLALDDGQRGKALSWFKRAHELNPGHEETLERIRRLEHLEG